MRHQLGNLSLIGVVAVVILEAVSLPASAAILADWRFDPVAKQLEITLQDGTTPHYFLLDQPPRIVLDLPNTRLGRVIAQQNYSGQVRQVRVSQFQPNITRIVLELSPLVNLVSEQVQLQRAESLAGATQADERWLLRPFASQNTAQDTSVPALAQSTSVPVPSTLPPATFDPQQVPTVSVPPPDQAITNTMPEALAPTSSTPLPTSPSRHSSQMDHVANIPALRQPRRVSSGYSTAASMLRTTPRSTNLLSQADKPVIEFGQPLPKAPQQATATPTPLQPAASEATPLSSLPKLQPAAPVLPLDTYPTSTVGTPSVLVPPPPISSASSQEAASSDPVSDRSIGVSTSHSVPTAERTSSQSPDILLPAGTQFSVRYAGEFTLTLKANSPLKQVLLLQEDLRDLTGNLIAPADTPVIGHFETNGHGSRFIAQAIARSPQNLPLAAQSNLLTASSSATLLPGQVVQIRLITPLRSSL